MERNIWEARAILRSDLTAKATHLTKGPTEEIAFENLWSILTERKLQAGSGYVIGPKKVCCFQDVPLIAIAENLRFETENLIDQTRYSPFGIRMDKITLYQKWGRPVIYGKSNELKEVLPVNEHWRIVKLNLTDPENMYDWTHEREWRVQGDLSFEYEDIEIIVKDSEYYKKLIERCFLENKLDIIKKVNGILPLSSIYT